MSCSHLNRTEFNSVRQALARGELFNPLSLNLTKCKEVMRYSANSYRFLAHLYWLGNDYAHLSNPRLRSTNMANKVDTYMGFPKEPKSKTNVPQSHVIGENEGQFTVKVAAFTDKGKTFVGFGECDLYKVNKAGLKAAKADLDYSRLIDLNRQIKTDVRNDTARLGELRMILAKFAKGQATEDEKKKVFRAAAQGNLGKDIQAKVESMIQAALK